MGSEWKDWLRENNKLIERDIMSLATAPAYLLREANPPFSPGVYMFLVDGEIMYVGQAKGSGGLRDRILKKHVSGADTHTLQKAFKLKFPDRIERREFLRDHISVKWIVIDDADRVPTVERQLIQMLQPSWNSA